MTLAWSDVCFAGLSTHDTDYDNDDAPGYLVLGYMVT